MDGVALDERADRERVAKWLETRMDSDVAAVMPGAEFDDRTPPKVLVDALVPLLDRLSKELAQHFQNTAEPLPADLGTAVASAAWPPVSDERPLQVQPLVLLEQRICCIERALRAIHQLEVRRLSARGALVDRVGPTSAGPKFLVKSS